MEEDQTFEDPLGGLQPLLLEFDAFIEVLDLLLEKAVLLVDFVVVDLQLAGEAQFQLVEGELEVAGEGEAQLLDGLAAGLLHLLLVPIVVGVGLRVVLQLPAAVLQLSAH